MKVITMPQAGQTMEEGRIVAWLKAEGDSVRKGEIIAEIETDKAVLEFECPEDGMLHKILQGEGAVVPVHEPIALVGDAREDVGAFLAAGGGPAHVSTAAARESAGRGEEGAQAKGARGQADEAAPALRISPAARKAAEQLGVDITTVRGTGPAGRITHDDVLAAATRNAERKSQPAGEEETTRRPMSKMRKAIAANLQAAKQTIPHFYAKLTIDASALVSFYHGRKAAFACSLTDVIVMASARAVREFPEFRSRIEDGQIVEYAHVNIGVAVATENGLVVQVISDADSKSLAELSAQMKRIVAAAYEGKLEGTGKGVFTVTNLGMHGVEEFAAIINPPESAILAVGAVRDQAVVRDGAVVAGRVMTLTLSADHRIIDGVAAARFLARLKELLEKPDLMDSSSLTR